jgi:hypothetical protein
MSADCMEAFIRWFAEHGEILHKANIDKTEAAFIFSSGWNERKRHEALSRPSR